MSRRTSPILIDGAAFEGSVALAATSTVSIFGRMMVNANVLASLAPVALTSFRDLCQRPTPQYNKLYNPFQPQKLDLPSDYSPYIHGQPLFDDREVDLRKLPRGKVLASANKKPKRSWTWELGYGLVDLAHPKKYQYWACKRCKSGAIRLTKCI